VEVEALLPSEGRSSIDVMMAVWTPGSYLIREYERNVESVTAAANGRQLAVEKRAKNRWRIQTDGGREVTLRYRVYCHEMTVRTNWVDADVAVLNGAPTFISLAEPSASESNSRTPQDVRLELPPQWKTSVSALAAAPDGLPNHYRAADYDTLVDSPIIAGNPSIHTFTVDDKPHYLVDVGESGAFDAERAQAHLMRIIAAQKRFWGSLPYDRYLFFNLLTRPAADGTDGLEHRNSVMMMASRWATGSTAAYRDWLSTASHEFFHLSHDPGRVSASVVVSHSSAPNYSWPAGAAARACVLRRMGQALSS
jgi:predicted metalloprotease with PDZ domain